MLLIAAIAAAETAKSERIGVIRPVTLNQSNGSGFLLTTITLPVNSASE